MLKIAKPELILTGTLLAIDPSSGSWNSKTKEQSYPGYALFKAGVLVESGVVQVSGKNKKAPERLRMVYDALVAKFTAPDILAIELIRGRMAHETLKWAVGVSIAAIRAPIVIEVPIMSWKKWAGKDHIKTDENDAVAIGMVVLEAARK